MRKTIRAKEEVLVKVLNRCGYNRDYGNPHSFRRDRFHVIIYPRRGRVRIHIHKDSTMHLTPVRRKGEDLEREFNAIITELKKR